MPEPILEPEPRGGGDGTPGFNPGGPGGPLPGGGGGVEALLAALGLLSPPAGQQITPGVRRRRLFGDLAAARGGQQFQGQGLGMMPDAWGARRPNPAPAPGGGLLGQHGPGAPAGGGTPQFSYDPGFAYNDDGQFSGGQLQQNLVMLAGRGGAFDPGGSNFLRDLLRKRAVADADSRVRQAVTGAEAYGFDDPYLRNYARINAQENANRDVYRNLTDADLQSALQNQRFLQDLVANYFGGAINRRDPKEPNALASAGGQAAGAFLGSLARPG